MTAEILRRAATLMRERAKAAPGDHMETACAWGKGVGMMRPDGSWLIWAPASYGEQEQGVGAGAAHIASWHPAVALAVADWLDATAQRIEEIHDSLPFSARLTLGSLNVTAGEQALAVARAYLGGDA